MLFSDKTKRLAMLGMYALLDVVIGTLALWVGGFATDRDTTGPVQTGVTFIVVGLAAGLLCGRRGFANPWIKGLLVSATALVLFVSMAWDVAEDWKHWHQSGMPYVYWHLERYRSKLAFTALPLLFFLSSIAGAGLLHLLRPSAAKVVEYALLDILIGAVFFYGGPIFAAYRINSFWLTMVMLIVTGLAAGFLRGRSGFSNPWVKGLLIGGAALFLSVVMAVEVVHFWQPIYGSVPLYGPAWQICWPLSFVVFSSLGAWLRNLRRPPLRSERKTCTCG